MFSVSVDDSNNYLNIQIFIVFSFRQQQVSNDSKIAELHNENKLKSFEAERLQLIYEETCRNLKQEQLENEKLHTKQEVIFCHPCGYLYYYYYSLYTSVL